MYTHQLPWRDRLGLARDIYHLVTSDPPPCAGVLADMRATARDMTHWAPLGAHALWLGASINLDQLAGRHAQTHNRANAAAALATVIGRLCPMTTWIAV